MSTLLNVTTISAATARWKCQEVPIASSSNLLGNLSGLVAPKVGPVSGSIRPRTHY